MLQNRQEVLCYIYYVITGTYFCTKQNLLVNTEHFSLSIWCGDNQLLNITVLHNSTIFYCFVDIQNLCMSGLLTCPVGQWASEVLNITFKIKNTNF